MGNVIDVVNMDILNLEGYDAIINSASNDLKWNFWVDSLNKKIHQRAGSGLDEECARLNEQGGCKDTMAVTTGGYDTNYKYIIHTVAPNASAGCDWLLYKECYINSLCEAKRIEAKRIALPIIGIGHNHYDKWKATDVAIKAILQMVKQYEGFFEKITIVSFHDDDLFNYISNKLSDTENGIMNFVSVHVELGIDDDKLNDIFSWGEWAKNSLFNVWGISSLAKSLADKFVSSKLVSFNEYCVTFWIFNEKFDISYDDLLIKKQEHYTIVATVNKSEIIRLMDLIIQNMFSNDERLKNMLNKIKDSVNDEEKFRLFQMILDWADVNNVVNIIVDEYDGNDEKAVFNIKRVTLEY